MDLLTTAEIAREIGVSQPTVQRWIQYQGLPALRYGHAWLVDARVWARWRDTKLATILPRGVPRGPRMKENRPQNECMS